MREITDIINFQINIIEKLIDIIEDHGDSYIEDAARGVFSEYRDTHNSLVLKHIRNVFSGVGHYDRVFKEHGLNKPYVGANYFDEVPSGERATEARLIDLLKLYIKNDITGLDRGGNMEIVFEDEEARPISSSMSVSDLKTRSFRDASVPNRKWLRVSYQTELGAIHVVNYGFEDGKGLTNVFLCSYHPVETNIYHHGFAELLSIPRLEQELIRFLKETGQWLEPKSIGKGAVLALIEEHVGSSDKGVHRFRVGDFTVSVDLRPVVNEPVEKPLTTFYNYIEWEDIKDEGGCVIGSNTTDVSVEIDWEELSPVVQNAIFDTLNFELSELASRNPKEE